jgi:hypothetical protein
MRSCFDKMKKSFPLGDWFPAPTRVSVFSGSVESSKDQSSVASEAHAFEIINYNDAPSKVVVALGSVQSPNDNPVFPPQTNIDPQSGSTFNYGSTLYLNVTLANGTVTAAAVSTSPGTVSATKAVVVIGSVSSDGFISQFVRNNLFIYSCGDNQFFQGIFS